MPRSTLDLLKPKWHFSRSSYIILSRLSSRIFTLRRERFPIGSLSRFPDAMRSVDLAEKSPTCVDRKTTFAYTVTSKLLMRPTSFAGNAKSTASCRIYVTFKSRFLTHLQTRLRAKSRMHRRTLQSSEKRGNRIHQMQGSIGDNCGIIKDPACNSSKFQLSRNTKRKSRPREGGCFAFLSVADFGTTGTFFTTAT